ncbi:PIR protein [Plasmodium vivax]|uniref:VIR protein n=1 Tax=Plasmodium vivax TaxID=5855 RepID=A0A565A8J3_PLAVI|nr:PIR protein [Plasmodium vivax]
MSSSYGLRINIWQKYQGANCYNKYSIYKDEIEKEIDNYYKITNGNFYSQWYKLNKNINDKNNEIKDCSRKNGISLDLFADDTIKGFSELCINKSACRTKPSPPVKKHAALQSGAKGPCKEGNSCQRKNTRIKSPKAKPQSLLPKESSNTISSPNPKTKNLVHCCLKYNLFLELSLEHFM